jgi:hypothetical protein
VELWQRFIALLNVAIILRFIERQKMLVIYEGRLKSSWTHLITPGQNFVEVRWRSLLRSTSLVKRYTSYNAPPTSRKRAANRQSLEISCVGTPFSWLEKSINRMGRGLDCMADVLMGFHRATFSKPNTEFHDSSVGIPLGYGLDGRRSRFRFPAGAGNFPLHHRVQNGSGAHPASYPMGTRGSFHGGKAAGA